MSHEAFNAKHMMRVLYRAHIRAGKVARGDQQRGTSVPKLRAHDWSGHSCTQAKLQLYK